MATVKLNFLVSDVRKKIGNVVFSKWKDSNYVKEYTQYSRGKSPKQIEVRNAFSLLISTWKSMGGLMQESWNTYSRGLNMTGLNAFIKANSKRILSGQELELFKAMGEEQLVSLTAGDNPPAGSVICSFLMSDNAAEKYLAFFTQKIADGKATDDILMREAGINPVSPFTIVGLEPGAEYYVYAIVTDSEYSTANLVSAAVCIRTNAGQ